MAGEAARSNMQMIINEARNLGVEIPEIAVFMAGQVFYKKGKVEEVRLALAIPTDGHEGQLEGDAQSWHSWTTPVPPQLDYQEGQLHWNSNDAKRCHLSAIAAPNEANPNTPNLMLLFDLRDNIPHALPQRTQGATPLPQTLRFTCDNIHGATIQAWGCAREWQPDPAEKYFRGFKQERKNLKIEVYLPNGDKAESLWEFLKKSGAATVKAHYALWARYYEQAPDGLALQYVFVNINDFCRDLNYAKAKNGGYKADQKRQAMRLLEALTTTEMAATYQMPQLKSGHTRTKRLKGTIWTRGLEAEENDTYADLFGMTRSGDPERWVPVSFSFAPGAWHADPEWRRDNRYVGKIGAGLMRLRCDKDEWAILIGGYLGAIARIGRYRDRRLKISTILENTGLGVSIGHRHAQFRDKFYRALDRLQEEGVIKSYQTEGFDDSDVDPEDLAELAAYGQANPYPPGDWRGWMVQFEFDFAADASRLQAAQMKAIESRKRKAQRRHKPKDADD
jgi:hypothetical protein